ncbi:MAG TPA: flagellar basal-body rod protein FlgF [Burkholderiaceae bacterium]|nr:flagellar basal-body rod protein FlgF [Burkholderiaceae bacterium]
MDRMIYLSMTGAKATMQRQEVLAHNLANASTPGFRAELTAFRAVPVLGEGAATRVYALESTPGYNAEPGAVQATGRNLDVAMKGNTRLAVQGLDGTEAYTRTGALDVNNEGVLITKTGLTVLGDGGPITVPANAQVQIAPDGTISAAVGNARPQSVGKLKLVTPESPLQRGEDGLFRGANGDVSADPEARVQDSALEGSNVSPVETMIAMIAAARQFEQQMKMVHSAQEKEQAGTKLLSNG